MSWIKELKKEIELVPTGRLPDYKLRFGHKHVGCRKCGVEKFSHRDSNNREVWEGPSVTYEPAFRPNWWQRWRGQRAHTERLRRECRFCKAVYYEAVLR